MELIVVLVICKKMKKIWSKKKALSANEIIHRFFRRSRADYSAVLGLIRLKFELIQAFIKIQLKMKENEC